MEQLFKVLNEDGTPCHGGTGRWFLPRNGQPGDWMPPIEGELVACENGYHLCRLRDLVYWLGPVIYQAEYRGERLDCDGKIVVREARLTAPLDTWNERTARLFACDCAEHVLGVFEGTHPNDDRPRNAIRVARLYADGKASSGELARARTAGWLAAAAAAAAAALHADGGRAAARAADAAADVDADADAAAAAASASAAALASAAASASAAALGAERQWQVGKLTEYLFGSHEEG